MQYPKRQKPFYSYVKWLTYDIANAIAPDLIQHPQTAYLWEVAFETEVTNAQQRTKAYKKKNPSISVANHSTVLTLVHY